MALCHSLCDDATHPEVLNGESVERNVVGFDQKPDEGRLSGRICGRRPDVELATFLSLLLLKKVFSAAEFKQRTAWNELS